MEKMIAVEASTQDELRQDLRSLFQGAIRLTLEMVLEEELKAMVGARRFERRYTALPADIDGLGAEGMIWADTASTDNKISVGRWNGSGSVVSGSPQIIPMQSKY